MSRATEEETDFTIDQQWRRFLERAGAAPGEMHPIQESEMSKAFYAASGQILLMARDELGELDPDQAVLKLEGMLKEIGQFWKNKMKEDEEASKED